jgi:hypothetical protein
MGFEVRHVNIRIVSGVTEMEQTVSGGRLHGVLLPSPGRIPSRLSWTGVCNAEARGDRTRSSPSRGRACHWGMHRMNPEFLDSDPFGLPIVVTILSREEPDDEDEDEEEHEDGGEDEDGDEGYSE